MSIRLNMREADGTANAVKDTASTDDEIVHSYTTLKITESKMVKLHLPSPRIRMKHWRHSFSRCVHLLTWQSSPTMAHIDSGCPPRQRSTVDPEAGSFPR